MDFLSENRPLVSHSNLVDSYSSPPSHYSIKGPYRPCYFIGAYRLEVKFYQLSLNSRWVGLGNPHITLNSEFNNN